MFTYKITNTVQFSGHKGDTLEFVVIDRSKYGVGEDLMGQREVKWGGREGGQCCTAGVTSAQF